MVLDVRDGMESKYPSIVVLSIFTLIVKYLKVTTFNFRKSDENNLRIISKPHAHLQTIT